MNFSGPKLTAPETFRLALETTIDSGLSKSVVLTRLDSMTRECRSEFGRAKSSRNFWYVDYWRGNLKRLGTAMKLVQSWTAIDDHIRIPISKIYGNPSLRPVDKQAAKIIGGR